MSDTATREGRTVLKEVPNAVQYNDGTILLKNVRASYPHVFKVNKQTDKKTGKVTESYGITGLMDKTTHAEAKKLLVGVINGILKEKNKGEKIKADRKFLRDGDPRPDEDGDAEPGKPEEAGMWVVRTREQPTKRPMTLHRIKDRETGRLKRLKPGVQEDEDVIYGGCYVNILIRPWWQGDESGYGKRVNCGIVAVQFVKDGEPFGSGRIRDEDLDATFDADEEEYDDTSDEL